MSVVGSAKEIAGRRGGSEKAGVREYRRAYLVETNQPHDSQMEVLRAPNLPTAGTPYATDREFDGAAIIVERSPKEIGDTGMWWEVDVLYSSSAEKQKQEKPDRPKEEKPDNPLDWAARYNWGFTNLTVPMVIDADDKAVVNSAGDPFDPLPVKETCLRTVTITRNEPTFDVHEKRVYDNKRSANAFLGFDAGMARMLPIRSGERYVFNGISYFEVIYEIVFAYDCWQIKLLDQGPRYYLKNAAGDLLKVLDRDDNGVLTGKHVQLDGNGFKRILTKPVYIPDVGTGGGGADGADGKEHWIKFNPYPKIDFGPLGLT